MKFCCSRTSSVSSRRSAGTPAGAVHDRAEVAGLLQRARERAARACAPAHRPSDGWRTGRARTASARTPSPPCRIRAPRAARSPPARGRAAPARARSPGRASSTCSTGSSTFGARQRGAAGRERGHDGQCDAQHPVPPGIAGPSCAMHVPARAARSGAIRFAFVIRRVPSSPPAARRAAPTDCARRCRRRGAASRSGRAARRRARALRAASIAVNCARSARVPSSVPRALAPAPPTSVAMRSNAAAVRSMRCTSCGSSAVTAAALSVARAAASIVRAVLASAASIVAERAASVRDSCARSASVAFTARRFSSSSSALRLSLTRFRFASSTGIDVSRRFISDGADAITGYGLAGLRAAAAPIRGGPRSARRRRCRSAPASAASRPCPP